MTVLQANLDKAPQLQPDVRWAYIAWVNRSFSLNLSFRVVDVARTAAEQHELWRQGRDRPGKIVTNLDGYKRASMHQLGLAVDIYPINGSYREIAEVGAEYGITHPFPAKDKAKNQGFIDEPHFQFDQVPPPPTPQMDGRAKIRALERSFLRVQTKEMQNHILQQIERIRKRL